ELPWPLLRFLVRLLLIAPRAELLPLRPFRVLAPVFGREIVPTLTDGALHYDIFAWHLNLVGTSERWNDGMSFRSIVPSFNHSGYFEIFVTTPGPTVLQRSRS